MTEDNSTVLFGHPPRRGAWRPWLLLVLPPILLATISAGFATIAVVRAGGDTSVIDSAMQRGITYILAVNHGLLYGLMLWFLKLDGMSLRQIGWPSRFRLDAGLARETAIGIVGGAALYGVHQYVWGPLVSWLAQGTPTFRMASGTQPLGSNAAMALVVGVALGGFVEEQIYRGYVLVRLSERMGLPVAAMPMLVFFGLLHFGLGWTGMLVATLTGLMLTLLFVWRRSLVPVVLAHALINVLVLVL